MRRFLSSIDGSDFFMYEATIMVASNMYNSNHVHSHLFIDMIVYAYTTWCTQVLLPTTSNINFASTLDTKCYKEEK